MKTFISLIILALGASGIFLPAAKAGKITYVNGIPYISIGCPINSQTGERINEPWCNPPESSGRGGGSKGNPGGSSTGTDTGEGGRGGGHLGKRESQTTPDGPYPGSAEEMQRQKAAYENYRSQLKVLERTVSDCDSIMDQMKDAVSALLGADKSDEAKQGIQNAQAYYNYAEGETNYFFRSIVDSKEAVKNSPHYENYERVKETLNSAFLKLQDLLSLPQYIKIGKMISDHRREIKAEYVRLEKTAAQDITEFQSKVDNQVKACDLRIKSLCFAAETPITIKKGGIFQTVPISEVRIGDSALSCNLEMNGGTCEIGKVSRLIQEQTDHLIKITVNGQSIRATEDHPFYRPDLKDWVQARTLEMSDPLLSASGEPVKIEKIEHEYGSFPVFNITVEGNHNYFAANVLVQNCTFREDLKKVKPVAVAATTATAVAIAPLAPALPAVAAVALGTYVLSKGMEARPAQESEEDSARVEQPSVQKTNYLRRAWDYLTRHWASSSASSDSAGETGKKMLGENGTQVTSKTVWKGQGKERIDVENPNPGQRPGQIHHQDNDGNKYLYDPATDSFIGAPKKVNDLLQKPEFRNGIKKAMKYLGEQ